MVKTKKTTYPTLGILLLATILIWLAVFEQAESNLLEVTFFDVGQGDAIFIETPYSRQVLIDGGPDATVLEKLSQAMPFYDRSIDLIILTHPDADHLAGLVKVLEYYQVGHILTSGLKKDTATYGRWQELIKERNIPLTKAQAGQIVVLEKEISLKILWPEQALMESFLRKVNNASVVTQLIYGQTEFLLPGDIEKEIEERLLNRPPAGGLVSDVLKVSHHGSKTSSSHNFIKAVNPQISVISVGANNRFGHPHLIILDRLKNSVIYRTDKNGDIEISTDGVLLEVKTEK